MFVRSRIDKPLIFRKGGRAWTLKPHAVTLINDPTVTAKEIKGCYGSRVEVISEEGTYVAPKETRQVPKNVVKSKVDVKPVSKSKKVDEATLDNILDQVNKELGELKVGDKKVDVLKNNRPSTETSVRNNDGSKSKNEDSKVLEGITTNSGNNVVDKEETKEEKVQNTKPVAKKATKTRAKRTTRRRSTKKQVKSE